MGVPSIAMREAVDTLTTITEVSMVAFDRAALGRLFTDHPRIAALFFVIAQQERVRLIDRIVSLGRTPARSRLAAVFAQVRDRLRMNDPGLGATFPFPLNQEELADMTGLTPIHVNRTLKLMGSEGLIKRQNGRVTILDDEALSRAAELPLRTVCSEYDWLPAAH